MSIKILTRKHFNRHPVTFGEYNEDIIIQGIQLAEALDYVRPQRHVMNLINRHRSEFEGEILCPNLGQYFDLLNIDIFTRRQFVYLCVTKLVTQGQLCILKLLNNGILMRRQFADA